MNTSNIFMDVSNQIIEVEPESTNKLNEQK